MNSILLIPIYLALWIALKSTHQSMALTALNLGLVGTAAYFSSNTAFEILQLNEHYTIATTPAQQSILLAAGQALLVKYEGTAFIVYYILNAIALILFATAMRHSRVFSKNTAYIGICAGVLMLLPSTFGTIGLIFAFASLFPWILFSILIARTFFQIAQNTQAGDYP